MATYYGSAGNDSINGSSSPDEIYGYEKGTFPEDESGNDILRGGAGNDRIYGGGGDDTLMGDEGGDTLYGGDGADLILGGEGNDVFDGGAGDDILVIADGKRDYYSGGQGADTLRLADYISLQYVELSVSASVETIDLDGFTISGTSYSDIFDLSGVESFDYAGTFIDLGAGNDRFTGHSGADYVKGGEGNDTLVGGDGDDVFSGGNGADYYDGGAGNDLFKINDNDNETYLGGSGTDTIELEGATVRSRFILDGVANVETLDGAGFTLAGTSSGDVFDLSGLASLTGLVSAIDLGLGDDSFIGHGGADTVFGNGGSDTIDTGGGKDIVSGGSGNDTLSAGAGNDRLTGGTGTDLLYGGDGSDTFIFHRATESPATASAGDTIGDFGTGDSINLKDIDANTRKTGNNAFLYIGTDDFSHRAGELRIEKDNGDVFVYGDTNGDGKADVAILLSAAGSLSKADFLL